MQASVDVNQYKGLIAKKAIESWYKLPPKTRAYIDVEDLIQEGMIAIFFLIKRYDKSRKVKFSTLLHITLENGYKRKAEKLNAIKRFDGNVSSVEDMQLNGFEPSMEESFDIHAHVVRVFLNVYAEASDELKSSMRRWFLQYNATKVHVSSMRFQKDKKEFLRLAKKHGMDESDCRIVMCSAKCQAEIDKRLPENVFVDLEIVNGCERKIASTFNTEDLRQVFQH